MVLDKSEADICITIGKKLTGGFGAGGNPEIAYAAAEENTDEIKEMVNDANMVILTAGMGGGTGTGALPYIAKCVRTWVFLLSLLLQHLSALKILTALM